MSETRLILSKKYFGMMGSALQSAENNLVVLGDISTCISKSYYAVFYGMLSLLYLDAEFKDNGHKGTIMQFNKLLNCGTVKEITCRQISNLEQML